jgi:hypothetical protein
MAITSSGQLNFVPTLAIVQFGAVSHNGTEIQGSSRKVLLAVVTHPSLMEGIARWGTGWILREMNASI